MCLRLVDTHLPHGEHQACQAAEPRSWKLGRQVQARYNTHFRSHHHFRSHLTSGHTLTSDINVNCVAIAQGQDRGAGNERNLVHLVEKSVEIKLKSLEIKVDFLEIKLRNQPNPPAPPTFTAYDIIFEGNHREIKEKSGNLVRQNCSLRPLGQD